MPVTVQWSDDDKTVLHMVVTEPWSADVWLATAGQASAMADAEGRPVTLIIEYRVSGQRLPPHVGVKLTEVARSPIAQNDLIERIIVVGKRGLLQVLTHIFRRAYTVRKTIWVDTLDDAFNLLT